MQTSSTQTNSTNSSLFKLFKQNNFRFLWLGEFVSVLGDQFSLIALPWLVLQITGSALAMGIVLAIMGIPRAVFMLLGGAITDRFSPRTLMIITSLARMVLTALLAFAIISGSIAMWMIYIFALLFGLADAFFYPANSAMVPQVVGKDDLQMGNGIIHSTAQISVFLGPALAGLLIAFFSQGEVIEGTIPDLQGIGFAFGIDALTFLLSTSFLLLIQVNKLNVPENKEQQGVLESIRSGIDFVWQNITIRTAFLAIAVISVLINPPLIIGIPILAEHRLSQGAAAFGILSASSGLGSLFGTLLAGTLPQPAPKRFGTFLFIVLAIQGIAILLLSFAYNIIFAGLLLLFTGASGGYFVVQFITWLQRITPAELIGRVMSLVMFLSIGLIPVTEILFGALIEISLGVVLFVSGLLLTVLGITIAFQPAIRNMGVMKTT